MPIPLIKFLRNVALWTCCVPALFLFSAEERVGPQNGPSGFGVFHTSPENPSGTLIAYNTWERPLEKKGDQTWMDLWVCDQDLTNHRLLRKRIRRGGYHNGSGVVWVDNQVLLSKGTNAEGMMTVHFIDVSTGEDIVKPFVGAYPPDSTRNGLTPLNVPGSNTDSRLGEPGLYLYDYKTDSAEQIVSLKHIHEHYVDALIGSDNWREWRIFHSKISTDGSYMSFNVHTKQKWSQQLFTVKSDGSDLFFWGHDKPSHFFFVDGDALMGVDGKVKDGLKDDGSLRIWSVKKEVRETFHSGTWKHAHNAVHPGMQLAASDQYQEWAQLDLYRRGGSDVALNVFKTKESFKFLLKELKGHINPAFSRDGRYLYYSRPTDNHTIQAYRFRIPDELLTPLPAKSLPPPPSSSPSPEHDLQSYDQHSTGKVQQQRFHNLLKEEWENQPLMLGKKWHEHWFLDGKTARLNPEKEGLHFKAGPTAGKDADHAVLWSKENYIGNVLLRYSYTRTDEADRFVNIAYLHTQGDGRNGREKNIASWADKRDVPKMSHYFGGMNLLHISYAAFTNDGSGQAYIRARRYDPARTKGRLKGTELKPDYSPEGLFEPGVEHRITLMKHGRDLFFEIETDHIRRLCHWDLSNVEDLSEGRIGFRHMASRGAVYQHLSIATQSADPQ